MVLVYTTLSSSCWVSSIFNFINLYYFKFINGIKNSSSDKIQPYANSFYVYNEFNL